MPNTDPATPKVFLSHQWADKHIADQLSQDLSQFAEVWLDVRKLTPGLPIQEQIDKALEEMDVILVLWSSHSAASKGVEAEIETGRKLNKPIVPLFIEHGDDGRPKPAWPAASGRDFLGIDLHHYGMGLARLAHHLMSLTREKLPEEAARELEESPMTTLMKVLSGDSDVLRYTNSTGSGNREYWVEKISASMANWISEGESPENIAALLETMGQSDDPDLTHLRDQLLGRLEARPPRAPIPNTSTPHQPPVSPSPGPVDELQRRLTGMLPANQVHLAVASIRNYISSAGAVLQTLHGIAQATSSSAGMQVVFALNNYLNESNDLIPDHMGDFGRIDDAWLINNTAYRLVEAGIINATMMPVDWNQIQVADQLVISLLPPDVLQQLSNILMSYLQIIAAEVMAYQPQFSPYGHGYEPLMGGNSIEDEFNRLALGTGLSL